MNLTQLIACKCSSVWELHMNERWLNIYTSFDLWNWTRTWICLLNLNRYVLIWIKIRRCVVSAYETYLHPSTTRICGFSFKAIWNILLLHYYLSDISIAVAFPYVQNSIMLRYWFHPEVIFFRKFVFKLFFT